MNESQTATTIPQPGTLSPALTNAVARILAMAAQAAMSLRTDGDVLRAIGEIQQACFVAEMEHYGHEEERYEDDDIPF